MAEQQINKRELKREVIDRTVKENAGKILDFIREAEREHIDFGVYNHYDTILIYFDLNNHELYKTVSGQGVGLEIYDGIHDGTIIQVSQFKSGRLAELMEEGFLYSGESEDNKEEYMKTYVDIFLENIDIEIDYLCALK